MQIFKFKIKRIRIQYKKIIKIKQHFWIKYNCLPVVICKKDQATLQLHNVRYIQNSVTRKRLCINTYCIMYHTFKTLLRVRDTMHIDTYCVANFKVFALCRDFFLLKCIISRDSLKFKFKQKTNFWKLDNSDLPNPYHHKSKPTLVQVLEETLKAQQSLRPQKGKCSGHTIQLTGEKNSDKNSIKQLVGKVRGQ